VSKNVTLKGEGWDLLKLLEVVLRKGGGGRHAQQKVGKDKVGGGVGV